jgi:ribulose-phosphate 3-epimerase
MEETMEKVRYLHQKYPHLDIQVDGGIGAGNAERVSKDGANWLVAGSALFCAENRSSAFKSIHESALKGLSANS